MTTQTRFLAKFYLNPKIYWSGKKEVVLQNGGLGAENVIELVILKILRNLLNLVKV